MNKYFIQLAQNLTYIKPDEWQSIPIEVFEDYNTETKEDCTEYVIYLKITNGNEEIASKAMDIEDEYYYDIYYCTDLDKVFVGILGNAGNKEDITEEVSPDTLKLFKDHIKEYAKQYREINPFKI